MEKGWKSHVIEQSILPKKSSEIHFYEYLIQCWVIEKAMGRKNGVRAGFCLTEL